MHKPAYLLLLMMLYIAEINGQYIKPDSMPAQKGVSNLHLIYQQANTESEILYNGRLHAGYDYRLQGHAYFGLHEWQKGSVVYKGMQFQGVPMMYDLVKDELVILHYNRASRIILVSDKVSAFSFGGNQFVRLVKDEQENTPPEGFYQLLSAGKVSLYVKDVKLIENYIDGLEAKSRIIELKTYYLLKDGRYHSFGKAKNILKILGDKRKALQAFGKRSNINFKEDPVTAVRQITDYYNQLVQ